jgi:hypothetical protein
MNWTSICACLSRANQSRNSWSNAHALLALTEPLPKKFYDMKEHFRRVKVGVGDKVRRNVVRGVGCRDHAVQVSTNLAQWDTAFTTHSPVMPFNWTDTNAESFPLRFYRLLVGPPLP